MTLNLLWLGWGRSCSWPPRRGVGCYLTPWPAGAPHLLARLGWLGEFGMAVLIGAAGWFVYHVAVRICGAQAVVSRAWRDDPRRVAPGHRYRFFILP